MVQLTPDECRVLGVLVEKAHTVASQYPMSLNAIVVGSNQKSNRDPVLTLDEDRVMRALDSLRAKQFVVFADTLGSRVTKFKHTAREALQVGTSELVILTELLLRGPQTTGELRGRASRMHELGSLEEVRNLLQHMMELAEPLVRRIPPAPGGRAEQFAQLLCPDLHPIAEGGGAPAAGGGAAQGAGGPEPGALEERLEHIEAQLAELRAAVRKLAESLGEGEILGQDEQSHADTP
jgi:uncharacterized protein YceH (UPF0502 family)